MPRPRRPSYAEAFVTFLTNLWDACGADLTGGVFPSVPDFGRDDEQKALRMTATEARAFGAIVEGSLTMARAAYGTEGVAASAAAWREVFGPKFPVQAATTVSASKAVAKTQSESDWEDDDEADVELAHIDLPAPTRLGTLRIAAGLASS